MLPVAETPLERVERDIAWLKGLPDIVVSTVRPQGQIHLGPWEGLNEHVKEQMLGNLDWSGVDPSDRQRIMERAVDYEVIHADIFYPFRRNATR